MTLESKKVKIAQWVLSLADEPTLDRLAELARRATPGRAAENDVQRYAIRVEDSLNLDEIKRAQGFTGVDLDKVERLIREADIEQPIEDLLADLD